MTPIKRMYTTTHKDTHSIRAWMAHQIESRWFVCTTGTFIVKLVKVVDFARKTPAEEVVSFTLNADDPTVLFVPPGYASGFKAEVENSQVLLLADYAFNEINDSYKFTQEEFLHWDT